VSHRPLATVTGLTIGDYLLWNWSLNANHDVLALVSGLTLPPLTLACLWLVALTVARLIARGSRAGVRGHAPRAGVRAAEAATRRPRARWSARRASRRPRVATASGQQATPTASPTPARSSRKIAA
jgi:hypothetical protein